MQWFTHSIRQQAKPGMAPSVAAILFCLMFSHQALARDCLLRKEDKQDIAMNITRHAIEKHKLEFEKHTGKVATLETIYAAVQKTIDDPNNRIAFKTVDFVGSIPPREQWNSNVIKRIYYNPEGFVVIFNKEVGYCGTAFWPAKPVDYYNNFTKDTGRLP